MRKLTKLEKFGLIAAILIAGTYFYMGKIYDPQARALKKTVSKLNSTIQSYNKVEMIPPLAPVKKALALKEQELDELKKQLKAAGGRTGEAGEVTRLLNKINRQARASNMVILRLTPQDKVQETLYIWDVFELQMMSDFPELLNFLRQLKALQEPLQVRNMVVEKANTQNGDVLVSARLLF